MGVGRSGTSTSAQRRVNASETEATDSREGEKRHEEEVSTGRESKVSKAETRKGSRGCFTKWPDSHRLIRDGASPWIVFEGAVREQMAKHGSHSAHRSTAGAIKRSLI